MEKVLEKFKALYQGEERLKRHSMLLLLLLIPSIAAGISGVIDKEVPKEILIPALLLMLIFMLLSIIPGIFYLGFWVDFSRSRIMSKVGLPKLTLGSFVKGLKVLPLFIVWGLYGLIIGGIILIIPVIPLISLISSGNQGDIGVVGSIILFFILFIILYLLVLILYLIFAPFFNYIYLSFIEDFVYRPEYFNPMTLVYYMKMVFKDTMLVMLKFLLAAIIINTVVQIVLVLVIVFASIAAGVGGAMSSGDSENIITPVTLIILLPATTLATMVQYYVCAMIGLASSDAYVDIYKEQIRLPDPAENNNSETTEE